MKKFSRLFLICLLASFPVFGQDPDNLFSRLSALSNSGVIFYNVDGIEISSERSDSPFSAKNIAKSFRRYSIKEKDLLASDSALGYKNFYIQRASGEAQGMSSTLSYYFIETSDGGIMGLTFARVGKADSNFDRMFARMVRENAIPSHVFSSLRIDSIQFAGRKILLGSSCRWMGVNNVQCPYYGQMNWSVHKNLEGAEFAVKNQLAALK